MDSNHLGKPNDFYQYMEQYKTCSESAATISKQFLIDYSEVGLFPIGKRLLTCSEESWIYEYLEEIITLIPLT